MQRLEEIILGTDLEIKRLKKRIEEYKRIRRRYNLDDDEHDWLTIQIAAMEGEISMCEGFQAVVYADRREHETQSSLER